MKRTHAAPHAKLTAEQVLEIRGLKGRETYQAIAGRFGINPSLVGQIINRDVWRWLKAPARAMALLIVVVAAAGAQESELFKMLNACDTSAAAFLNLNAAPDDKCNYQLTNLVVFQKVQDGYLLAGDFATGGTEDGLLFLKTKAPLKRGMRFEGEKVHPIGTYQYQAVDGFAKEVWAFGVTKP